MIIALALSSCGFLRSGGDDVARAVGATGRSGALDDATRYGDDVLRTLRGVEAPSVVVLTRMNELADELSASPAVREAVSGLLWEVGCDVVTGEVPRNVDDVSSWLALKAVSFGLQFFDGSEQAVAQLLLEAMDDDTNEATERCNQIPTSGL